MVSCGQILAVVVAVAAVLAAVEFLTDDEQPPQHQQQQQQQQQLPQKSVNCPWGSPVLLRSVVDGTFAQSVGQDVRLRPESEVSAGGDGFTWIVDLHGGFMTLSTPSGKRFQDHVGRVGLDLDPKANVVASSRWSVESGQDGHLRFMSMRLAMLVNEGGRFDVNGSAEAEVKAKWQFLSLEGKPVFIYECWKFKKVYSVVNDGWVSPHKQTPDLVPEPSILANYTWKPFHKVTEEEIRHYNEHGWVLLKQVVEPEIMDTLYREAELFCKGQIAERNVCQIEMLRWQLNTFRDFLFYGPLGSLVSAFVGGTGLRVSTEALFGTVFNDRDPNFFSYQYHTDASGQEGVFHGFATGVKAAAAWFPLHDVDAEVTGGGIKIVDGYPGSICKYKNCGGMLTARGPQSPKEYNCPGDCSARFGYRDCARNGCKDNVNQRILSFKKGDIVIWHSDMPHATQSTKQVGFKRYSFTVRFVERDTVMCDVARSCGGWMACCKDTPLVSGQKVHSYCWPQVYPEVLDHEVKAHYGSTPKFVIADEAGEGRIKQVPASRDCDKPANAK